MIIISKDGMSICNTFDFTIVDNGHAPSVYNIINKLDGNLYGVYQMPTCKHVLDEIANQYDRFPHSSYRFPQYDYDY